MRGKDLRLASTRSTGRDHPRLCGEKLDLLPMESITLGSPPPMRGKVIAMNTTQTGDRITPAYAGKSFLA